MIVCGHDYRPPVIAGFRSTLGVYDEVYTAAVEHQERLRWQQWQATSGPLPVALWVLGTDPSVEAFLFVPEERIVVPAWATRRHLHKAAVDRIYWSLSGVAQIAPRFLFEGVQNLPLNYEAEIEQWMAENGASAALWQC